MIKIKNKVAITGFLSVEDLKQGDLFAFLDEEEVYLMTDSDYFVRLPDGEIFDIYGDENYPDRPVRTLHAEMIIIN
jgi:hypothetical protein